MRRVLIGLAGLLLLAGAGWLVFQRQIGAMIYARAVDARVGGDLTAGLPDGLHL